jgi:hypothetical protein
MNGSDQTSTLDPDSPEPPPYEGQYAAPAVPAYASQPSYAPRPRFADQVVGMRAVIAVALACLVLGGAGGAILGAATNGGDNGGFGGRGGFPGPGQGQFQPHGPFPNQGQFPQGGQAPNGG